MLHAMDSDRCRWLVLAAFTQLRLARAHVADLRLPRLPWERHYDTARLTPVRVHRVVSALLARHTRQGAETLWTLSGAAQRAPLRRGQALSGSQEGRLNPQEDSGRRSFARGFISSPKLLVLKTQQPVEKVVIGPVGSPK